MSRKLWTIMALASFTLSLGALSACGEDSDQGESTNNSNNGGNNGEGNNADQAPFGTAEHVAMAQTIWGELEGDYTGWPLFPGSSAQQASAAPHGATATIYVSQEFMTDPANPPAGSTVIKENYDADNQLAALTVMQKVDGFNPEDADWFFVKFSPDGSIDSNDAGTPLAGAIGKGGAMGCIPCHGSAAGGDYLYSND